MKKVLGLMLALVVSAGLFALDLGNGLSVGGGVYAGVYLEGAGGDQLEHSPGGSAVAYARYDDDYDGLRAQVRFTYAKDNVSATVRFRYKPLETPNSVQVTDAWGKVGLLGGKIDLYAGLIDNSLWGSGKLDVNYTDTTYDNDGGVKLDFKVVPNLSFGFSTLKIAKSNLPLPYWFNSTTVGVRYTDSSLIDATIAVQFDKFKSPDWLGGDEGDWWDYSKLDSRNDDNYAPAGYHYYEAPKHTYFDMSGGAMYLGLSNVKVGADFRFAAAKGDKMDSDYIATKYTNDDSLFAIFLDANYASGPVSVTFKGGFTNTNHKSILDSDKSNSNVYTIPLYLDASYKINDTFDAVGVEFEADFHGKGGKDASDDEIKNYKEAPTDVTIKPYLGVSFGNGAGFKVFDKIKISTSGQEDYDNAVKSKSKITNILQLNFFWEF